MLLSCEGLQDGAGLCLEPIDSALLFLYLLVNPSHFCHAFFDCRGIFGIGSWSWLRHDRIAHWHTPRSSISQRIAAPRVGVEPSTELRGNLCSRSIASASI